jgi:hypothetical protein
VDQAGIDKLNRGRTIRLALPPLLDLLNEQLDNATGRLIGDFRSGETNFLKHAAEIATITELKDQLLREEIETQHLEEKLHDN